MSVNLSPMTNCTPLKPVTSSKAQSFGAMDEDKLEQYAIDGYQKVASKGGFGGKLLGAIILGGLGLIGGKKLGKNLGDVAGSLSDGIKKHMPSEMPKIKKPKFLADIKVNAKLQDLINDIMGKTQRGITAFANLGAETAPDGTKIVATNTQDVLKGVIKNISAVVGGVLGTNASLKDKNENGVGDLQETLGNAGKLINTAADVANATGLLT